MKFVHPANFSNDSYKANKEHDSKCDEDIAVRGMSMSIKEAVSKIRMGLNPNLARQGYYTNPVSFDDYISVKDLTDITDLQKEYDNLQAQISAYNEQKAKADKVGDSSPVVTENKPL